MHAEIQRADLLLHERLDAVSGRGRCGEVKLEADDALELRESGLEGGSAAWHFGMFEGFLVESVIES